MREYKASRVLGWSATDPPRKWTVWIDGKRKGEVIAKDPPSAETAARRKWRTKATTEVEVRPKFPLAQELLEGEGAGNLEPSTPHDAHVIIVALAILEWTREALRSRVSNVRQADLDNLLRGRSNGAVKARVFNVLSQAGCDLEEISRLIDRVKRTGESDKGLAVE